MTSEAGRPKGPRTNIAVPQTARIWNYWLGGEEHFRADRRIGDQMASILPGVDEAVRAVRAFCNRSLRYQLTEAGIRQFVEITPGLPIKENTHDIAQAVVPSVRIVYVDHDPTVLAYARALMTGNEEGTVEYVDGDVWEADLLLEKLGKVLDLSEPVGFMAATVLGYTADDDEARSVVDTLMGAVPSGSHLTVADMINSSEQPLTEVQLAEALEVWNRVATPGYSIRDFDQARRILDGVDIVEPGFVPVSMWRPEAETEPPNRVETHGAVARKP